MFLAGLQSAAAIQIKHPAGGRIQAPYTVNSIHIHIHWHTCPGNGSVISNHIHHAQSYPNISPADADTCLTAGVHLGSDCGWPDRCAVVREGSIPQDMWR